MILFFRIFWWLLPAAVANITPVLVTKRPFLDYPIDGGIFFFKRRLFGSNKTWRGLSFGVVAGVVCALLQNLFITNIYLPALEWGVLLSAGALAGDLAKSFLKRRLNIDPGQPLWFFDQVDWIFGALITSQIFVHWKLYEWLFIVVTGGVLHIVVNILGYYLNFKNNPY